DRIPQTFLLAGRFPSSPVPPADENLRLACVRQVARMKLTTLKLRRLEKGILQVELATRANVPRARLSEIENGHLAPKGDELGRIATALAVPVERLLEH